jgi:nitronate monooxygenase
MALPAILKDKLRLPVVGAPLFIVSHPALTLAQCKAGVIGAFPALNARPESQLDEWLAEITEGLAAHDAQNPDRPAAPFAVNQIVHRSNKRLEHDLMMCVKYKVPVVISSLGAVPEVNAAIHSYGGIVLHDVINNRHASSAIRKGADGLIAVANGSMGLSCSPARSPPAARSSRPRRWVRTWPISAHLSSRRPRRAQATPTSR